MISAVHVSLVVPTPNRPTLVSLLLLVLCVHVYYLHVHGLGYRLSLWRREGISLEKSECFPQSRAAMRAQSARLIGGQRWTTVTVADSLVDSIPKSLLSGFPSREKKRCNFLKPHYEANFHVQFYEGPYLRYPKKILKKFQPSSFHLPGERQLILKCIFYFLNINSSTASVDVMVFCLQFVVDSPNEARGNGRGCILLFLLSTTSRRMNDLGD